MTPENPIAGGTVLRLPALQSPNYVAGTSGWIIRGDGTAEFNNEVIRTGTSVGGTELTYSSTPTANNLVASLSGTSGVDPFGNAYLKGSVVYGTDGFGGQLALQTLVFGATGGALTCYTATTQAGPWTAVGGSVDVTGGVKLNGPVQAQSGTSGSPSVITTDTWNNVSFVNSWVNQNASNMPLRYRLNTDQTVDLKGIISSGTSATVCTLPSPYYNTTYQAFSPIVDTGFHAGFCQISTSGVVTIHATTVSAAWIIDMSYPLQ